MNLDRVQWGQRESEGEENVTLWLTHPPHNPPPPEKKNEMNATDSCF